nr:MAG TPA: hypothetical protein [Caudoviricetes sp.]
MAYWEFSHLEMVFIKGLLRNKFNQMPVGSDNYIYFI